MLIKYNFTSVIKILKYTETKNILVLNIKTDLIKLINMLYIQKIIINRYKTS